MSLRIALGCHPVLGEDDSHVSSVVHALRSVGAEVMPLTRPEQWPDLPPDVLHYAGPFHVQSAVNLVAHAQRIGVPFFLTCRFSATEREQSGDLWERGEAAAVAAAKVLFAPESTAAEIGAELGRDALVALPEIPDLAALENANPDKFRSLFRIDQPYLLLPADRVEEEQQQHLLLAAAKMTNLPTVVLGRTESSEYRARCDFRAVPATVYAGSLSPSLRGGAVLGPAAAVLMAPRHRDHSTHLLTALAAGLPVVAGPGTAVPESLGHRVVLANPSIPTLFAEAIHEVLESHRSTQSPESYRTPDDLGCALLRGYGAIPAVGGRP